MHGRRADASTKIRVAINQQCLGDEGWHTDTRDEGEEEEKDERRGEGFSAFPTAGRAIGGPMTDKTSSFSTWFRVVRDKSLSRCVRIRQCIVELGRKIRALVHLTLKINDELAAVRSATI